MTNPRPAVVRPGPRGAKRQAHRLVASREGNGARREGHRGSHSLIVPWTPENLYRRDPVEGRGLSVRESWPGNPAGALHPGCGSTKWPRIAKRVSETLAGRTGCVNCARPDLWEAAGVTPPPTRPRAYKLSERFPNLFPPLPFSLAFFGPVAFVAVLHQQARICCSKNARPAASAPSARPTLTDIHITTSKQKKMRRISGLPQQAGKSYYTKYTLAAELPDKDSGMLSEPRTFVQGSGKK